MIGPTVIDLNKTRNGWWQVTERDVGVIRSFRNRAVAEQFLLRAREAAERLDRHMPKRGTCQVCGWHDQRHRMVEALAGAVKAGDAAEDVADDYGVSLETVQACVDWVALDDALVPAPL